MNRKNPKPPKNIREIKNLAEEYAEILHLRKQVEAAASGRPAVTRLRLTPLRIDTDLLSPEKPRKQD